MWIYNKSEKGFSLIEALIATVIVCIGFTGVYTLITLSEQFTKWAMARQKLQMYADQMLEVLDGDIDHIDNYTVDLTDCVDPGAATETYLIRSYEWCIRMRDELGDAGNTDTRSITITGTNPKTALIILEAYGAKAQIIMERTYGS